MYEGRERWKNELKSFPERTLEQLHKRTIFRRDEQGDIDRKQLREIINNENEWREKNNIPYLDSELTSDVNVIIENALEQNIIMDQPDDLWFVKSYIKSNYQDRTKGITPGKDDYFFERYEMHLKECHEFGDLQWHIKNNQGIINKSEFDRDMERIQYMVVDRYNLADKISNKNQWNFILRSPIMQETLSQLKIVSQEEYDKYIQSITPTSQKPQLTAPDLGVGAIICVILCCITFIFNYFWVFWIMIWVCYYFWRKEQIRKFNPQYFREKEKNDEEKNL